MFFAVVLRSILGGLLLGGPTGTTAASAPTFAYDAPITARLHGEQIVVVEPGFPHFGGVREESASLSSVARVASTTSPLAFVATEAAPAIKDGSAGGGTAGQRFPTSVRNATLEENPSTCVYCRMETDASQVEHAIPKSRGGNATIENAQTTCGRCNASKGARDFPVSPPADYEGQRPPPWWLGP